MMPSTTTQSAILKTKKRLYNDQWLLPLIVIAVSGIFPVAAFGLRAVSMTWRFGETKAEIPLVSVPIDDPSYHRFVEKAEATINGSSPTVVLSSKALYFGTVGSFTKNYLDAGSKMVVMHVDGSPQIRTLLSGVQSWMEGLGKGKVPKFCILVPTSEIPLAIVIKVVSELRDSQLFDRVILANGIL